MNQLYTAAVTLLALLLYLIVSLNVGEARRKYEVRAPATTGNEHFERAYRVQMNTLEQMAFFLPSLWLSSSRTSPRRSAVSCGSAGAFCMRWRTSTNPNRVGEA